VIYLQGNFSESLPFGFSTEKTPETGRWLEFRKKNGTESGYEFYQKWSADRFPRVIAVTFQHPSPFGEASYVVNSANQGPYGDAIMKELIPYIEEHFRIIREPYARALTGGSTGGWEALALQLYHPAFFGGAWIFDPDHIDFRRFGLLNIYEDENAFVAAPTKLTVWAATNWHPVERYAARLEDGQPLATTREVTQVEELLGSHGRSSAQYGMWNAAWGPVGDDGYPKPLWDPKTGEIDRSVASYMREHGYDLREYAESHWSTIGPHLIGKLRFYCGEMDNWYLNLAVYLFEDFLRTSANPHYAGFFQYGRPLKQHGWTPMTHAELIRAIADQVLEDSPPRSDRTWANRSPAGQ
jgi:hypothetical protein